MSMPFTFVYDNVSYPSGTTLIVNQCGSVNYGTTIYATYNNRINPSNTSYANTIAPLTGLQYVTQVYYMVTGTAPNRVFTMEWDQCRAYPVSSGASMNYQMKLYETSNMIEFYYSTYNFNLAYSISYPHSAGLNGSTSPSYVQNIVHGATSTNNSPASNYRFVGLPNNQLSVSPKAMNFGSQFTGTATFGIANAKHVGNESVVNLISATISGPNASDFTVIAGPTPSSSVAIGATSTYTIQFIPSFGGARSATLTIRSDGRDSGTQTIALSGVGVAPKINVLPAQIFKSKRVKLGDTAEQSIVIQSVGAANLYFTNYPNSFSMSGDVPGDYIVSRVPQNPMPAGATDTLKIKFVPTVEGARFAQVNVNSNAENSLSWPVLLKGIGTIPRIALDKSVVIQDSIAIGGTSCQNVTISNPGSDTLRILKHYFASKDGDYSFTPLPNEPYILPPNQNVQIQFCFTPLQRGTRVARFRILTDIPKTMEQPKQDTASIDINFSSNGVPLDKSIIVQKQVDNAVVGGESVSPLEFTNVGSEPIVVTSPIISGANASEFSVTKVKFPMTVAPGQSVNMSLTCKPSARGERTATVLFNCTREDVTYTTSTDVKANALLACASTTVHALTFEKLLIGETSANVFEVSNCGDVEQTFTATVTGSKAFSVDGSTVVIPAGEKANVTVSFAPNAEGEATATLSLKGTYTSDMTVNLSGVGEKPATASVGRTSESDGFVLEQNAPNPALGYTNISFTSPKIATVRIYLADMTGKMVKEVVNSNFSSGSHNVTLDTKDLSSGSYIYILESNNVRLTRQMVVTK